jgi:hypothetical protein
MRQVFTIILSSIVLFSFSQRITLSQWEEEAQTNKRLLPKYGHIPKSANELESDSIFIKSILETDGTLQQGSKHLVELGFNYMQQGDIRTAMYRFNQGWLLDSLNANVYWGFGAVNAYFGQTDEQIKKYTEGLELDPLNTNILTDYGTIHLGNFYDTDNKYELYLAIELLRKAYQQDPENYNTLFKLSICYYNLDDCYFAWKYWDKSVEFGGMPIMENFTRDLRKKCVRTDESYDYSIFKIGIFHHNDEQTGLTKIIRTENTQIEENIDLGIQIKLQVEWIDESIYKLTFLEDLNGGKSEVTEMTLFCRITKIDGNTYMQANFADISPIEMTSKIEKIE